MTTPNNLGELEQLVLLALLHLEREGYGVTVRDELARRGNRVVSLGTVYTTLLRLETKGLITSRIGEPTSARGGRRKKLYAVTGAGRSALNRSLATLRRLSHGLAPTWEAP